MSSSQFPLTAAGLTRRHLLGAAALTALAGFPAMAAPKRGQNGLFDQPWMIKSDNLAREFAAAMEANKHFAVLWESVRCPWCQLLHTECFQNPNIAAYIEKHFAIVQLNFYGTSKVIDFDGKTVSDRGLAAAYEIMSSPTLQFIVPDKKTPGRELGRTGYMAPPQFHGMLRFVVEKGYEEGPFDEWFAQHG